MRKITDARAPFADIETALDVGMEHLQQQVQTSGGAPVGLAAIEQTGGYFVRISWTTLASGGRAKGRRRQQHTAEIGKIMATDEGLYA
jgi:hypothetical protein